MGNLIKVRFVNQVRIETKDNRIFYQIKVKEDKSGEANVFGQTAYAKTYYIPTNVPASRQVELSAVGAIAAAGEVAAPIEIDLDQYDAVTKHDVEIKDKQTGELIKTVSVTKLYYKG